MFLKIARISYVIQRFSSRLNTFTWRSHTCGELNHQNDGENVTLCGWIAYQRYDKFLVMKDAYGLIQVCFENYDTSIKSYVKSLPLESVIQVDGTVKLRPEANINKKMPTGWIEVIAKDIKLLSSNCDQLPFTSRNYEKVNEVTKQKYRYISLRTDSMQEILRSRSHFIMKIRQFLYDLHGFVEVETPTLFKKTPGGAKEFIVPTKFPGRCYSLVQSPQQFKQLLMVGSIDRYFQIARCYRNEGTKSDRQPEFTQLDIEASFTADKDIRNLVEQLVYHCWPTNRGKVTIPFPCITYSEAMRLYGTDKPDNRFEIKINNITELVTGHGVSIFDDVLADSNSTVSALVLPIGSKHIKNSMLMEFKEKAKEDHLPNVLDISIKNDLKWDSFLSKHLPVSVQSKVNDALNVKTGDLVLLAAGKTRHVNQFLGKLRVLCAERLQASGVEIFSKSKALSFLWVIDFPLFLESESGEIESAHHPFTAPHAEDIDLVYTEPLKARSLHYDLVLNGQEVGGGSIRIHHKSLQQYILEEILKEDSSSLQHLLDALESGCPPHGGIALGVDRLMAVMFGCKSISEVIAFPKSLDGKDLLSGAPSPITNEDKSLYHIETPTPVDINQ